MNKSKKISTITWIVVVLLVVPVLAFWAYAVFGPGEHDAFAECLGEKGAKFYGASWCGSCQKQKSLFGKSKQYLPYIECATEDGRGQTEVCKKANIKSYPTWVLPEKDRREEGWLSFEDLEDLTGCEM